MRKAGWQEHEVAGHVMSAVKKQENDKEIGSGHQTSRPVPSNPILSMKSSLLKISHPSKQQPQLEVKCSSTGAHGGHFIIKPQQRQIPRL